MSDCPLLPTCLFFNDKMPNMPLMTEIMKETHCRRDNSRCARFLSVQPRGAGGLPVDLYPNDIERAEAYVSDR